MAGPDDTPGALAEDAEDEVNLNNEDVEESQEPEEPEGRPARKKARTRSHEYVYDEDGGDDTDDSAAASSSSDDGPDPIDPFINSAVALSRGHIHFASAPQAAVGALLNSQNEDGSTPTSYAYSWDSILGMDLGGSSNHVVGTAAMAQHINSQGGETDRGLTPSQIAAMVRTHRPRTCRPPNGSGLVDVVHNAPSENALWFGEKKVGENADRLSALASDQVALEVDRKIGAKSTAGEGGGGVIVPYSTLARLYETMCQQDASSLEVGDDGETTFRRECRYMTAPKVVETLRQYENGMVELDKRERDTMEVGKELGLLGNDEKDGVGSDVAKYLGYSSTS